MAGGCLVIAATIMFTVVLFAIGMTAEGFVSFGVVAAMLYVLMFTECE